jgi:hypothetical protein
MNIVSENDERRYGQRCEWSRAWEDFLYNPHQMKYK